MKRHLMIPIVFALCGCAASPIEVAQEKCANVAEAEREECLVTTAAAEERKRQAVLAVLAGTQGYANARASVATGSVVTPQPMPTRTTCQDVGNGTTRCTTY